MMQYKKEVAQRVFAQEFGESDLYFKEGEDQYAPNYLLTPTGAKCNRMFIVGILTENEEIGDNYWMARVADPTGIFLLYTGGYWPRAVRALSMIAPPAFIAVVGKPNVYERETGVVHSIRSEYINVVDVETRDHWIIDTAEHTIARIKRLSDERDDDIVKAKGHYSTDPRYYMEMVLNALEAVER